MSHARASRHHFARQIDFIRAHMSPSGYLGLHLTLDALILIGKRAWDWLRALLLVMPGGMLLNVLTKHAFGRARPSFADPIHALSTYRFTSGHVAAATLLYGLLAATLITRVNGWHWRVPVALLVLLIVALVALSRVYLGAHYLSDVLAAFAESTSWLALCLTAMHTLRRRRGASHRGQSNDDRPNTHAHAIEYRFASPRPTPVMAEPTQQRGDRYVQDRS